MILVDNISEVKLSGNELKNYRRKKKILDLLYREDTLSATEIGKRIGVSVPTSLSLLKELSQKEFVEFKGTGESKGGRRPAMFGLKQDSILVMACELGRYTGKVGVFDSHNKLVAPMVKFKASIDDKDLIEKIADEVDKIAKDYNIDTQRIFGVGISMPGLIDEVNGINYTIKDKKLQNVADRIKARFHKLVYVNNDARMQAYGEFVFGQAKGHQNALIINWNWGLGMGMIMDGKLYNGATGFAGELSHTKYEEDGDLCICGKRGCLETVTSVYVLIRQAQEGVREGKVSQLTAKFKGREEEIGVEDIIQAARQGDEFSIFLLNSVGLALGKALSNAIQLLNPDIIVLGGAVSEANQYVLTPIQQSVNRHCLEQISGNIQIVISENWERSGLLGTTAMLYQKLFSNMLV
ncbi:ROK family transcriptional regulator [Maribellus luteus]|uniref:ROK family transcriptional regulator n=1 Tax=Maribellus luteus TaxID=2305463 RepID=A0A399SVC3_9BACT|nr:ROK family transcriptional regulator [Maribellus luteus]RIJ45995.1 ROK family transcriptional regulator [Maribellus luteus]